LPELGVSLPWPPPARFSLPRLVGIDTQDFDRMPSTPPSPSRPTAEGGPRRPPMDPAGGVRRIKLQPHEMTDAVTATENLFVLAHLGIPRVDPAQWLLTIDGRVGRTCTLGLDELKARPKRIVEAVHQCCGNPLEPHVPARRVANVRWGGVDLAALLDELEIDPRARFLWSYGLDGGEFAGTACDHYVKDLPLERLAAGDVLLAYELNGAPLPAEHGFPVRLVVPGYYGTNSVKWLWRLHLAERRAEGLFAAVLYNDSLGADDVAAGLPARRPVWALAPESIIVAPAPDTAVAAGELTEIWGWTWSFRGVAGVEISVDGGTRFTRAALEEPRGRAWRRFSLPWRPTDRGEVLLSARAFEANGVAQPMEGARNAAHTVRVVVR
jgi:DMSO/TMAO reductase YedYZ molybdopterin-dependent catalytic subunit